MAEDLPWREAIEKVLKEAGTSLHYSDIADRIVASKLRKSIGATPSATVSYYLTTTIKAQGAKAPFLKVGKGEYILRGLATAAQPPKTPEEEEKVEEGQYDIVTSFGMFWRRNLVSWGPSAKLLGTQQIGSSPVDFGGQLGIYLLYDGREVIYVGRSTERPLARRLYEHTADRLATRWDRFSWFGLLPVSEQGKLGVLPRDYLSQKIVPALEAVLVEAMEPRQNRRRGDDLSAVEYIQKEDPEIKKKQLKETFDSFIEKV